MTVLNRLPLAIGRPGVMVSSLPARVQVALLQATWTERTVSPSKSKLNAASDCVARALIPALPVSTSAAGSKSTARS